MTSPYDELPKNQANYAPLTPLTFIERAAYVYPDKLSVVHGTQALYLEADLRAMPAGWPRRCPAAASARTTPSRSWRPTHRRCVEAAFGVPMCGAVLNTLNTRLDAASHRLSAEARRGEGADHRPRILPGRSQERAGAAGEKPLVIDIDDPAWPHGKLLGRNRIRSVPRRRRSGLRLAEPGRRMGCDRAELYFRHHRRSKGSRVPTIAAPI